MKKIALYFLLLCTPLFSQGNNRHAQQGAITYQFSGGRFGDNVLSYMHAKWISYRYGLPLLYKPFNYSDELVLHERELLFNQRRALSFAWRPLRDEKQITTGRFLYILDYFPEAKHELKTRKDVPSIVIDWNDEGFRALLRELISPKEALPPWSFPEGYIPVAMHVRRGDGTVDSEKSQDLEPLRFPPDRFYIDELFKLFHRLGGKPLYIHIFTDDLHPEQIAKNYRKACEELPILFGYRASSRVLEDFFAMARYFTYLIRPQSNFSTTAAKIGNFSQEIFPESFHLDENRVPIIDHVVIRYDSERSRD